MNREELPRLLDAYRDGEITQGEAEDLVALVRASEKASAWVLAEVEIEGLIAQALDETDGEAFLRGFWERHLAEQDSEHFVHDFEEKRAEESTIRSRRSWLITASVVASMAVLAAVAAFWLRLDEAPGARLELVRGDVTILHNGAEDRVSDGTPLHPGDGLRVTGEESAAAVVFSDGTLIEFGEDTLVTSVSEDSAAGKRVVLSEGFFTAQVAKQPAGRPMVLVTPNSEIVVLGTTFSLSVGTAVTHLETQSGNVRLKRTSDGSSVEVPAGFDAVVAAAAGDPLVALPLAPRSSAPRMEWEGSWTAALSPDSSEVIVTSYVKGDVRLINATSGAPVAGVRAHDKRATTAAFTVDGRGFATGSLDGTVKWWTPVAQQVQATLSPGLGQISEIFPSRDGRWLTILSHEEHSGSRIMSSWDARTNEQRWAPRPFQADRLAFSPDGHWLATARKQERAVTIWDLEEGRVKATLRDDESRPNGLLRNIFSMAFSHDGRTIAVDDTSGLVSFWDLASGRVTKSFKRHGGRIYCMGFSPDDRLLATGQQDNTIRLWDIAGAAPVAALAGNSRAQARDVIFSRDGKTLLMRGIRLATASTPRDGIIQLWDVPSPLTPTKIR